MKVGDVVQFAEKHKWAGSLGIITEVKTFSKDTRYMVCVPMPQMGDAYIYSMESDGEIEYVGPAVLMPSSGE